MIRKFSRINYGTIRIYIQVHAHEMDYLGNQFYHVRTLYKKDITPDKHKGTGGVVMYV